MTNSTAVLRTYVYEIWTQSGQYLGFYPTTPANAVIAYSVHGIPVPPPPPAPSLSINASGFSPELSWGHVSGATSYTIYTDHSVIIDPYESIFVCYQVTAVNSDGESGPSNQVGTHAMAPLKQRVDTQTPDAFVLFQNHPNPFNPATTIAFGLPEGAQVRLTVYTITGQVVATLLAEPLQAETDAGQIAAYRRSTSSQLMMRRKAVR